MTDESKERRINPRSLENLKLGAEARKQGKVRRNTTLLPETIEWLEKRGNVSEMIDQLVASVKSASLKGVEMADQLVASFSEFNPVVPRCAQSNNTHDSTQQQTRTLAASNYTHESILDGVIEALREENAQLRSQLAEALTELEKVQAEVNRCHEQIDRITIDAPDLEVTRDHVLSTLKVGKQAPDYKRTKAAIDRFIAALSYRT